jgi:hypothetical protein
VEKNYISSGFYKVKEAKGDFYPMKFKFLSVLFFAVYVSLAAKNEFLSQDFIDTTIQTAYYGFVAANKDAGGTTQESAIYKAKGIVADLKKLAESDPNKRYILWRLSELEAQIGLEEEEVFLKKRYATVKKINELVEIFNNEVLQPRPSFANLHTLHQRMLIVDVSKTNEFAEIINQKNKSVSFNLKQSIIGAFNDNNYGKAEIDYNYAVENMKYLNIGNADIEAWRKKIQAKKDADYLKINIDSRVAFVNGIVKENRLLEAKRHIEVLNRDLNGASVLLTQSFISSTKMKLDMLSTNIDRREDSLVQYGYSLLSAKKYKEASDFLSRVLFPAGVDRNKTAGIDRAIIESEGGTRRQMHQSNIEFTNVSAESGAAMSAEMKQKMKEKTDSIRRANEAEEFKAQAFFEKKNASAIKKYVDALLKQKKIQKDCDDFLENILNMFVQGKGAAAVKKFKSKQALCFANATPRTYYDVKSRVNNQTGASNYGDNELIEMMKKHKSQMPEGKQDKAVQITGEIYDLLDKNQAGQAYYKYYFNKSLLDEFTYPEALLSMRKTLVKAYSKEMKL